MSDRWFYVDLEINPRSDVVSPLKGGRKKSNVGFFDADEGASRFETAVKSIGEFYSPAFVIRKVMTDENVPAEASVSNAEGWICHIKLVCVDKTAATIH